MNKNFSEKIKWFFTGYSYTNKQKVLYFIKRLVWLGFVSSAIKYSIAFIVEISKGNLTMSLILPILISALASILFFKFD